MKFDKLIILVPCHTLDGYSVDQLAEHAEEILSAWSALYHPALFAAVGSLPQWASAHDPPKDPAGAIVTLPAGSEEAVDRQWIEQAEADGALLIRDFQHPEAIVEAATEQLDGGPAGVEPELAADFHALGYAHLQMELLIRDAGYDMGTDIYHDEQYYDYGGQFDRDHFEREALAAAHAAIESNAETTKEHLRNALTHLAEARQGLPYTYSTDADPHLLDLTLVAPATMGEALRQELTDSVATNLLVSGEVIQRMAEEEPATLEVLRNSLSEGRATLIGGEFVERALPLLGPEAILYHLRRGLNVFSRHLGQRPKIFGRRRFGLTPVLPQILRKLGFSGAVHSTLDDGQFPTSSQAKIWWVGINKTELEAVCQVPIDASRASPFLNFAGKVSNASYHEQNATVVLAHWPGRASRWYHDLKRIASYSPVLGQFRTVGEYLEESQSISEWTRSGPDEYRSPYLRQAVASGQTDPISRWVRYHHRRAACESLATLATLVDLLTGRRASSEGKACGASEVESRVASLVEEIESGEPGPCPELEERLARETKEAAGRLARLLGREGTTEPEGCLVVNPLSFSQPGPIAVPGMGFAWVERPPATADPPRPAPESGRKKGLGSWKLWAGGRKKPAERPMAEEHVLRNEFMEVTFDPITGAIQAIHDRVSRGNRLGQQIALRLPRPPEARQPGWEEIDPEQDYSIMAADQIEIESAGPTVGRIRCSGRLLDREGNHLSRFVQTTELHRGVPILEIQIDLDIEREPGPNPWDSYYAVRFAWGDATADVYRGVSLASKPTELARIESPHFVELRSDQRRITILTGGLPYHRKLGLRKLDTLLAVRGETARSFRLGIGLDLTYPVPAALAFLAPKPILVDKASRPPTDSGWCFHINTRNVVATHWEPVWAEEKIAGFRARLLETEGRACGVTLRSFRSIASARKLDFQYEKPVDLPTADDHITLDLGPYEWVQVEAIFCS